MTIHGLDLNANADAAKCYEPPPAAGRRHGPAVVLIDHVVKDPERQGRFAIGAQHKLAGIDVRLRHQAIEPFGRGKDGLVRITVQKDRAGHLRQYTADTTIADMRIVSGADGAITVRLEPPHAGAAPFRPTVLMERISRALSHAESHEQARDPRRRLRQDRRQDPRARAAGRRAERHRPDPRRRTPPRARPTVHQPRPFPRSPAVPRPLPGTVGGGCSPVPPALLQSGGGERSEHNGNSAPVPPATVAAFAEIFSTEARPKP